MAYTAPIGDALRFTFRTGAAYSAPVGDAVHFLFAAVGAVSTAEFGVPLDASVHAECGTSSDGNAEVPFLFEIAAEAGEQATAAVSFAVDIGAEFLAVRQEYFINTQIPFTFGMAVSIGSVSVSNAGFGVPFYVSSAFTVQTRSSFLFEVPLAVDVTVAAPWLSLVSAAFEVPLGAALASGVEVRSSATCDVPIGADMQTGVSITCTSDFTVPLSVELMAGHIQPASIRFAVPIGASAVVYHGASVSADCPVPISASAEFAHSRGLAAFAVPLSASARFTAAANPKPPILTNAAFEVPLSAASVFWTTAPVISNASFAAEFGALARFNAYNPIRPAPIPGRMVMTRTPRIEVRT